MYDCLSLISANFVSRRGPLLPSPHLPILPYQSFVSENAFGSISLKERANWLAGKACSGQGRLRAFLLKSGQPNAVDHFLPFRSGRGYDRYRWKAVNIDQATSIARLKAVRLTLLRRDTGCWGTPFGSPIPPSLEDSCGNKFLRKFPSYRRGKDCCARPMPFRLKVPYWEKVAAADT
jgi:hypothetical protein